jgi:hypothetical protein
MANLVKPLTSAVIVSITVPILALLPVTSAAANPTRFGSQTYYEKSPLIFILIFPDFSSIQ